MSARSAQRTRWRRWRMGRAIAGRTDRNGRMSGSEAQVVGGDDALVPSFSPTLRTSRLRHSAVPHFPFSRLA